MCATFQLTETEPSVSASSLYNNYLPSTRAQNIGLPSLSPCSRQNLVSTLSQEHRRRLADIYASTGLSHLEQPRAMDDSSSRHSPAESSTDQHPLPTDEPATLEIPDGSGSRPNNSGEGVNVPLVSSEKSSLLKRVKSLERENSSLRSKLLSSESARSQDFHQSMINFVPQMMDSFNSALQQQRDEIILGVLDGLKQEFKGFQELLVKTVTGVTESSYESKVLDGYLDDESGEMGGSPVGSISDQMSRYFAGQTEQHSAISAMVQEMLAEMRKLCEKSNQTPIPTPSRPYLLSTPAQNGNPPAQAGNQDYQLGQTYQQSDTPTHCGGFGLGAAGPRPLLPQSCDAPIKSEVEVVKDLSPPYARTNSVQPHNPYPSPVTPRNYGGQPFNRPASGDDYPFPPEKKFKPRPPCLRCGSNLHVAESCNHKNSLCHFCKSRNLGDNLARDHTKFIHKESDPGRRSQIISLLGVGGFMDWLQN